MTGEWNTAIETLQAQVDALVARVEALEAASAPAEAAVPDVIASLYANTDRREGRENRLPADLVQPAPLALLMEED